MEGILEFFWTKSRINFLGFGANFVKKSIAVGQGVKKSY